MEEIIAITQNNSPRSDFLVVQEELALLEEQLKGILKPAEKGYFQEACNYLLQAPGKRLRPMLVFLAAKVTEKDNRDLQQVSIGTAVELLHMATLIHDDIIDRADYRRGQLSVNARFGNHVAVLLGDYCYGKSLEVASLQGDEYVGLMAEIINNLVAGEFIQYQSTNDPYLALNNYWDRIYKKTAFFFSACCRMGALSSGAPGAYAEIVGQFGECIGMAFQIKDDLMDLMGSSLLLGKTTGSDLKNGVLTLPVIHALNFSKKNKPLQNILVGSYNIDMDKLRDAIVETGAVKYTRDAIEQYINLAIQSLAMLPASPARDAMEELALEIVAQN